MRRLLSALRESQNCTDNECEVGPSESSPNGGLNMTMLLTMWGIAALVLFLTRPMSMRLVSKFSAAF